MPPPSSIVRPSRDVVHYHKLNLIDVPDSHFTSTSVAYYDNRDIFYGPSIIIPGYQQRKTWSKGLHCSLYYNDGSILCTQGTTSVELADSCNKYIRYAPSISVVHVCKLPKSSLIPTHVSLSSNKCSDSSSTKLLIMNRPFESLTDIKKEDLGICVQTPLYGKHSMQSLYEFIEMNNLLGVNVFTFYTQIKLDKFSSLSQSYKNEDNLAIDIIQWPSVFKRTTPVHYFGEILAIHDCLYRNMNRVKYLIFIDLDEVIVPVKDRSLSSMMERVPSVNTSGYAFDNVLMATHSTVSKNIISTMQQHSLCNKIEVPKYLQISERYMCEYKHPRRSKVIVHPDRVSHLDIHSICHHSPYNKYNVPHDTGVLYHYRDSIPSDCKERTLIEAKLLFNYNQKLLLQFNKRFCQ